MRLSHVTVVSSWKLILSGMRRRISRDMLIGISPFLKMFGDIVGDYLVQTTQKK